MSSEPINDNLLADKCIWIVDDEIPVQLIEYEHDDISEGKRPIDRGTLLGLIHFHHEEWDQPIVRDLCQQIISSAKDVYAFTQPAAAVAFLKNTPFPPDLIIFDLMYRGIGIDYAIKHLKLILEKSVTLVQVYTEENLDVAISQLQPLQSDFQNRLQQPLNKSKTNAQNLAGILNEKVNTSLSTNLAGKIRQLTSEAIENVLVKVDDLPLPVAVKLLAGEDLDGAIDTELVEFLAAKISDQIKTSPDLKAAVEKYAQKRGIAAANIDGFVSEMVELLVSQIRERVQYDEWLYQVVRSSWEKSSRDRTPTVPNKNDIIQNFFAYRIYDFPHDSIVRTGDLIFPANENGEPFSNPSELFMVLTPPCDLSQFRYKTRGVLTLMKLHPMTGDKGIQRILSCGNGRPLSKYVSGSITAKNPIYLPSLKINGHMQDYCMFAHEITFIEVDDPVLLLPENNKTTLYYSFLPGYRRFCKVSEPFLSGIISQIGDVMLRTGIPNMPDEEIERLKHLD